MKNNKKHYHFIGICGSSMSGIAQYLQACGNIVSGSDIKNCEIENYIDSKYSSKIKVIKGHDKENISKDVDLVVRSSAVTESSKGWAEVLKARSLTIPVIKRSEMIGKIISDKVSIGVTGMHGKTTVSSMIAYILYEAGLKPGYFIGSDVKDLGGNSRKSNEVKIPLDKKNNPIFVPKRLINDKKTSYFVVEACEYDRSFLDMRPLVGVITNIDKEHLDYYKGGIKEIKQAFKKFIKQIPKDGLLVVWQEDKYVMPLIKSAKCKVKLVSKNKIWPGLKLKIAGKHNLINATMAAKVAHELGIAHKTIKKALNNFSGAKRRFDFIGKKEQIKVYDDYAHHPTEIKETLKAFKTKFKDSKIIVVFQPHQQQRTKILFNDFVKCFFDADEVIFTDVFLIEGREKETKNNLSKKLTEEVSNQNINARYIKKHEDIVKYLEETLKENDVLVTMGATDIFKVGKDYLLK